MRIVANVIIPDHTLHDNEVDMSYHTFLELFRDLIIKYLRITENMTINDAYAEWSISKIRFNPKVYEIMLYILQRDKPMILLNRNPTLNFYSMLLLKIRTVKCDFNDYTLTVPLAILPGLNADQPQRSRSEGMVTCSYELRERLTSGVA